MSNEKEEPTIDLTTATQIDQMCDAFELALRAGEAPQLVDFTQRLNVPGHQRQLMKELLSLDVEHKRKQGKSPTAEEYQSLIGFESVVDEVLAATRAQSPAEAPSIDEMATLPPEATGQSSYEPAVGDRVQYFGDYELLDEIARGGMGVVYRAKQISLSRIIALKMILSGQIAGEDEVRRFQLEAEAAANLDHPGIVPIHDIGEHKGQHYFTMKLVDGKTLTELSPEVRGDHQRAVELVAKVADAIHHAHQRGILHRDLKPGNVLVEEGGQPLVTDFGLARNMETDQDLTQTGAVIGTPGFMPPEQASGKALTTAADIYSLGALLYELLCGQAPHGKESVLDTLMSVINDAPKRPTEVDASIPSDLELIVQKALSKDPAKRYASAAEFAADLRAFAADEPLLVRAPSAFELAKNWVRKNIGNVIWIPIIAIVTGAISGFMTWSYTLGTPQYGDQVAYQSLAAESKPWLMSPTVMVIRDISILLLVTALVLPGFLTAVLVKTTNRFSDIASGLSVGLLAGLICLVAGLGPVIQMTHVFGSGPQSMVEDLELLNTIAQSGETGSSVNRDYPATTRLTRQEVANALALKIHSTLRHKSLTGMWVATVLGLGIFSVIGVGQTMIAGSLIRSHSFGYSVFNYGYFSYAVVVVSMLIMIEVATYALSGDHYYIRWLVPTLCFGFGLAVIVGVARHWHLGITSVLFGVLGGLSIVFFSHFAKLLPPVVMTHKVGIRHELDLVKKDPTAIAPRQELVYERNKFANTLFRVGWFAEAKQEFDLALKDLAELDALDPYSLQNFDVGVRRNVFFSSANNLFAMGQSEQAHQQLDELTDQLPGDPYASLWQMQRLSDDDNFAAIPRVLQKTRFSAEDSIESRQHKGLALQWGLELLRRRQNLTLADSQASREEIVAQVLPATSDETSGKVKDWLLRNQTWHVYGPFELENPGELSSLQKKTPHQDQLLEDPLSIPPSMVVQTEQGAPIWFTTETPDDTDLGWNKTNAVTLAWSKFEVSDEQRIQLQIRSDDSLQVWVDGVHRVDSPQPRDLRFTRHNLRLQLAPGPHTLLLKVTQVAGDWGLSADAFDEQGLPLTWINGVNQGSAESDSDKVEAQ